MGWSKSRLRGSALLGLLASSTALACSGPGAEAAMVRAEVWGGALVAVCALLAVGGTLIGPGSTWLRATTSGLFVATHPGLWMSARHGDCGTMRLTLSVFVTIVFVAWATLRVVAARRKPMT